MIPSAYPKALIGFGQVRHTRLKPVRNAFVYPTYFLMLPMRSLRCHGAGALPVNRWGALSFYDADHGDARSGAQGGALAWLDELLQQHGITGADGEVWLQCYPRVLGHTFKPVSFWYCHGVDGGLRAIVVEVNNTFGERHCYLLDAPRYGVEQGAAKVFHVSPFCPVEGGYRFRFMVDPARQRTVGRIDFDDASGASDSDQRERQPGSAGRPQHAPRALALPRHDAGGGAAHPLAGDQAVCQAHTFFHQTTSPHRADHTMSPRPS